VRSRTIRRYGMLGGCQPASGQERVRRIRHPCLRNAHPHRGCLMHCGTRIGDSESPAFPLVHLTAGGDCPRGTTQSGRTTTL
jgi:hypothetical protein